MYLANLSIKPNIIFLYLVNLIFYLNKILENKLKIINAKKNNRITAKLFLYILLYKFFIN